MQITVYTKTKCPYCVSAKVWLNTRNYQYEEISLDNPADLKAFREQHPTLKTVPQIFVDGENLGGFSDLLRTDKL